MRSIFFFPIGLLVAGCGGSDDFTCSSKPVLDKIGESAREMQLKDRSFDDFDASKTTYRVDEIRQQSGTPHSISCAANVYVRFVPNDPPTQKAKGYRPPTKEDLDSMAKNPQAITYTVEKFDKGGFHVAVRW